ncbi:MAG: hypothetical protein KKG84_02485, partial [Candidatus Omnitrophica bacterium]|nr:hypothetical protein [Candidatus Omnitrophota bacterium]
MSKIKSHFFFKTISILVIISICAVDIARAYPEYSASSHALAAEVMSQRTPMDPSIIPYRDQLYEKAELLGASLSIARYLLGDEETGENPLSKDYLESVMRRELGNAVEGVIFPDVAVENGIVSVPIDKDGKSFTIRVALVSTLTPRELAVYDLVAGEKYAVEFVTEDTGRDSAQPEKAITAVVSEPVTEISLEPAAEDSSAFEARTEKLPWWRVTKFTVRNILQSLALVLIVSQIAFAAGDSSVAEADILKRYLVSFYEFLKLYVTPYIDYAIGSPARYKGIALLPWLKFIGMIAPFGWFAANHFVRGLRYAMKIKAEKILKLHIVIARYCALHLSILMTILAYVNFRTGYPAIAYPAIAVLFTFMGSFMAAGWFYVKNNIPYNEKVMHAFLKEKCSWREIVSKAFMWEYEILYRHRPWGYPDINAVRKYIRKEYPSEPSVGLREHMVGLMGIGYGESVFHDTFDAVLRMEENGISKDTGRAYFNEIAQEAGLTLTSLSLFFEGWDCSTPAKTIESQNEFIIS